MGPLTYPGQGHLCFMDSGVSVLLYNKHYEPGGLSDGGGFLTKASTAHTRNPQHRHGERGDFLQERRGWPSVAHTSPGILNGS